MDAPPVPSSAVGSDPVEPALQALARGEIVLLRGPGSEPGGRLVLAAQLASTEAVAEIVRHGAGIFRVAMRAYDLDRLRLPLIWPDLADFGSRERTAISVDARNGVSTGISAHDRALTARLLGSAGSGQHDFTRPGHVMPVAVAEGGVLVRPDRPEAALDLVAMAGLHGAAGFDDIANERGEVDDTAYVEGVAAELGLAVVTVEDVVARRRRTEQSVDLASVLEVSAGLATLRPVVVQGSGNGTHLALIAGDPAAPGAIVRVHRECLAGILGDPACGCRAALLHDLAAMGRRGDGVVLVLRQQPDDNTPVHTAPLALRPSDDDAAQAVLQRLGVRR